MHESSRRGRCTGNYGRLVAGLEPEYQTVHVYVLEDDQVNAFALPGGYVFVLTGLLNELQSQRNWLAYWGMSWVMLSNVMGSNASLKAFGIVFFF